MYKLPLATKKIPALNYIYLATFFLAFHSYLVTYINSSFLGQYLHADAIGVIYAVAAVVNIFIFLKISKFIEVFGNYYTMLIVVVLEVAALATIAVSHSLPVILVAFMLHQAISSILLLCLDNFLESSSDDTNTGYVRGVFNTLTSITAVVSPIIVGFILLENNYRTMYLLSALCILPLAWIVKSYFKKLNDDEFHHIHISGSIQAFLKDKNLRNIFGANLLLQIFYSWMVIYLPIYLNQQIGFSWQELGIMISIALLPFVFLEIPVGSLADKKYGEKEILILGFVVMMSSLFAMSFSQAHNFLLWATILFVSRVGASLIEITSESFFFKQINSNNQNLISTFRITWPLGFVIGPAIGGAALALFDERYMFAVLAIIMLLGVRFALHIKDTK